MKPLSIIVPKAAKVPLAGSIKPTLIGAVFCAFALSEVSAAREKVRVATNGFKRMRKS